MKGGKSLKKFIITLCFLGLFSTEQAQAVNWGYQYIDGAGLYSDVVLPLDASKAGNSEDSEKSFVSVKNTIPETTDLIGLKKGTSSRTNILGLVEWGDAGVYTAAKDGKIKKIHYIEVNREKLYVPMGFIPIYFNRFITTVYGE
jgi:hypothetical protein